jgi:hypothetical protein
MLMAGTNNFNTNTDAEIVSGVRAIIRAIHERTPNTTVLLVGLFPRNYLSGDARALNINKTLATFHNGSTIVYHDPRPWLTTADDKYDAALFADAEVRGIVLTERLVVDGNMVGPRPLRRDGVPEKDEARLAFCGNLLEVLMLS